MWTSCRDAKGDSKTGRSRKRKKGKNHTCRGRVQAAQKLADAAKIIATESGALQLRFLQTLTEIATEKNSTIIFPVPIDLIKPFLEKKGKAD